MSGMRGSIGPGTMFTGRHNRGYYLHPDRPLLFSRPPVPAVIHVQGSIFVARATLIDGKARAAELSASITESAAELFETHGVKPGLAVVSIGDDPASKIYTRNKKRTAETCGFYSVQHALAADSSQETVLALLTELNADPAIHGILVQLPLPDHLDKQLITQSVAPEKDVDGFHFQNIGKLTAGVTENVFVPCTGEWIKPGAIVIDVGINRIQVSEGGETKTKLTGDVDFKEVSKVAGAITPVPGGVGPLTIAMLMANTLASARRAANISE